MPSPEKCAILGSVNSNSPEITYVIWVDFHDPFWDEILAASLAKCGFTMKSSGLYAGNAGVSPVDAVTGMQLASRSIPRLQEAIKSVKLMRVTDEFDMMSVFTEGDE